MKNKFTPPPINAAIRALSDIGADHLDDCSTEVLLLLFYWTQKHNGSILLKAIGRKLVEPQQYESCKHGHIGFCDSCREEQDPAERFADAAVFHALDNAVSILDEIVTEWINRRPLTDAIKSAIVYLTDWKEKAKGAER